MATDTKSEAIKIAADAMEKAKWTPSFVENFRNGQAGAPAMMILAEKIVELSNNR